MPELAGDLMQVSFQLLQQTLKAREYDIDHVLRSGEILNRKTLEFQRVTVLGAPELQDLLYSADHPLTLSFPITGDQIALHPRRRVVESCRGFLYRLH